MESGQSTSIEDRVSGLFATELRKFSVQFYERNRSKSPAKVCRKIARELLM